MSHNNYGSRGGAYDSRGSGGGGGYNPDRDRGRSGYPGGHNPQGGRGGGGGDGDRYRSRSRENFGGDRGGGGRDGDRRGGGGRGRGGPEPERRPEILTVKTNLFKLEFKSDGTTEWIMYHMQIQQASRVPVKDENGEKVKDEAGVPQYTYVVKGRPFFGEGGAGTADAGAGSTERKREDGSTFLTRRILRTIQKEFKEKGKEFVTDGANISYSPVRLFEGSLLAPAPEKKAPVGKYGPADDGTSQGEQARIINPSRDYNVRVNVECDDEEMEPHERGKKIWFKVRFTEAGVVNFSVVRNKIETTQWESMVQCINLAIKNAMMMNLIAVGRSPRMFHFKPDLQNADLLGRRLFERFQNDPDQRLFLSLFQAARFTASSEVFLMADFGSDWFRPEFKQERTSNKQAPIKILQPDAGRKQDGNIGGKLAGVYIDNLEQPVPVHRRREVEDALKELTFHIKYSCGDEWEKKCRSEGKSDEFIKSKRTFHRRNKRVKGPKAENEEAGIIWAADDPVLHQFRARRRDAEGNEVEGEARTVCDYYDMRYDIQLQFPKMPLVRISDIERFPVEFLRQALEKIRNANSDDQKKHVLAFNHQYAGSNRISHLEELLGSDAVQKDQSRFLDLLNLRMERRPVTLKAKILPYPVLSFGQNRNAQVNKGSWNLRDVKFIKPAELDSFAVVDFTGGSSNFISDLLEKMKQHGIRVPPNFNRKSVDWDKLTVKMNANEIRIEVLKAAFEEAVQKAKNYFLLDNFGKFGKGNRLFFSTNFLHPISRKLSRVLVVPSTDGPTKVGLIEPINRKYPDSHFNNRSHTVTNPGNGVVAPARLMYHVVTIDGTQHVVDPFELRSCSSHQGFAEARISDRWVRVTQFDIRYKLTDADEQLLRDADEEDPNIYSGTILSENDVINVKCRHHDGVDTSIIECPSIVFVYLPDKDARRYNFMKLISHMECGVQSQCIVSDQKKNFDKQYQSNVAIKVNAKLSNSLNEAHSWKTADLPWISEVPTLIMGFYMSSAQGQDSPMVVAAAVSLNGMEMAQDYRIQKKSPIIAECIMIDLVKSLAIQFFLHRNEKPKRVLVYRAGGHDGIFQEIMLKEIAAVRKAFYEINQSAKDASSDVHTQECQGKGCVLCTPPITFIVAQSHHDVRIVPDVHDRLDTSNVPSGTCVDDYKLMSPMTGTVLARLDANEISTNSPLQLFQNADEKRFDFFLIAHGGLKGTSKPVYYRVLWNENYVFRATGDATPLTKDVLQKLTYYMSFDYATATKAPRLIPVLLYSSRLANVALGYLNYLIDTGGRQQAKYKAHQVDDFATVYVRSESIDTDAGPDSRTLPKFDPFSEQGWHPPFHPHLSA